MQSLFERESALRKRTNVDVPAPVQDVDYGDNMKDEPRPESDAEETAQGSIEAMLARTRRRSARLEQTPAARCFESWKYSKYIMV